MNLGNQLKALSAAQSATAALCGTLAGELPAPPPTLTVSVQATPGYTLVIQPMASMPADRVPILACNVTVSGTGDWSSLANAPGPTDSVYIPAGSVLTISTAVDVGNLVVDGTLNLAPGCSLRVFTCQIVNGTLNSGASGAPAANVTVTLKDGPIDTTVDPAQYTHGVSCLQGFINVYGQPKLAWTRCPALAVGAMSVTLPVAPAGWNIGDEIAISDTHQPSYGGPLTADQPTYTSQCEVVTVTGINGQFVTFYPALNFAHACSPWDTKLSPAVANLSRSVTFRSENPNGVRGHVQGFHDGTMSLSYCAFVDLGRTLNSIPATDTVWDSTGKLVSVPANQKGRYSCHYHHQCNSPTPMGLAIVGALKWGLVFHGTLDGSATQNVIKGFQGAGLVAETGQELGYVFDSNCILEGHGLPTGGFFYRTASDGSTDKGWEGAGIWTGSLGGTISNNYVSGCTGGGVAVNGYSLGNGSPIQLPTTDCHTTAPFHDVPPGKVANNECVSCGYGYWEAWPLGEELLHNYEPHEVDNQVSWNCPTGAWLYHTCHTRINNPRLLGNPAVSIQDVGADFAIGTRMGCGLNLALQETYEAGDTIVTGGEIRGYSIGILLPQSMHDGVQDDPCMITGVTLQNWVNVLCQPCFAGASMATSLENITFVPGSGCHQAGACMPATETDIFMALRTAAFAAMVPALWFLPQTLTLTNNGITQNFYYPEQALGFALPIPLPSGTPAGITAGETNAQLIAAGKPPVFGAAAPATATTPARVVGLVS